MSLHYVCNLTNVFLWACKGSVNLSFPEDGKSGSHPGFSLSDDSRNHKQSQTLSHSQTNSQSQSGSGSGDNCDHTR